MGNQPRRSSVRRFVRQKHCFCEAVAHEGAKCGLAAARRRSRSDPPHHGKRTTFGFGGFGPPGFPDQPRRSKCLSVVGSIGGSGCGVPWASSPPANRCIAGGSVGGNGWGLIITAPVPRRRRRLPSGSVGGIGSGVVRAASRFGSRTRSSIAESGGSGCGLNLAASWWRSRRRPALRKLRGIPRPCNRSPAKTSWAVIQQTKSTTLVSKRFLENRMAIPPGKGSCSL